MVYLLVFFWFFVDLFWIYGGFRWIYVDLWWIYGGFMVDVCGLVVILIHDDDHGTLCGIFMDK
jgi:hypothetical protein